MSDRIMKTDEFGHLVPVLEKNTNMSYSTPQNTVAMSEDGMEKKHVGFKELQEKLEHEGHSKESAGNIAYAVGAKKYGKKGMAAKAHHAQKSEGDMDKAEAKTMPIVEQKKSPKRDVKGKPMDGSETREMKKGHYTAGGQWLDKAVEDLDKAKIYDIKTKQKLADLPSETTPKSSKVSRVDSMGNKRPTPMIMPGTIEHSNAAAKQRAETAMQQKPKVAKGEEMRVDNQLRAAAFKGEEARNDNKGGYFLKRELVKFSPGNQWSLETVGPQSQVREKK